jgi:tripartite ATP-independent transporter DctP family solute receptor
MRTARAAPATVTMKVAYATGTNFLHHAGALAFKQAAETASQGRIEVDLFPGGQLGGEAQILDGVRAGTIECYLGATGVLSNTVPELGLLDLPYLWRDPKQAFDLLRGNVGQRLTEAGAKKGLRILDFWPAGRRDVYGNVRIEKPADFKGVKIRTLQTPVFLATFKAFGALPTPLAWPETYGALQQGVIDASETALSAMLDASQQEVSKYIVLTGHALTIAAFTVGAPWFDGLAPDLQRIINDAEGVGRAKALELDAADFQGALTRLQQDKKTIISPDLAPFRQTVADTVYPQFASRFDPALIKEITG